MLDSMDCCRLIYFRPETCGELVPTENVGTIKKNRKEMIAMVKNISWHHKSVFFNVIVWILINIVGIFLINDNWYVIPVFERLVILQINPYIRSLILSILTGLLFAILQSIFFIFYRFTISTLLWFTITWLVVSISLFFNNSIFTSYIFPGIDHILNHSSGFMMLQNASITVYSGTFSDTFISALINGLILGCINGGILGISQIKLIADQRLSKKWFYATLLPFSVMISLTSLISSSINFILQQNTPLKNILKIEEQIAILLLGLAYGISTALIMKNNVIESDLQKETS
jgi:hypothetical protein